MISNSHVQGLIKQLFPSDNKSIQPNDILNLYIKQGKVANPSELSVNHEVLPYFQEKDKSSSK